MTLFTILVLAYIDVYSVSYSVYEWKKGNKLGAGAICFLCICASAMAIAGIFV